MASQRSGLLLLLLATRAIGTAVAQPPPPHYERRADLSRATGCTTCGVAWTVDRQAHEIILRLTSAPGATWVGFGISENGGMVGADVVTVEQNAAGDGFVARDRFSTRYALPAEDVLQNVELLSAELVGTVGAQVLRAVVRRKLDTCDYDDVAVAGHKQHLIVASGRHTSRGVGGGRELSYHGADKATILANLLVDEAELFESGFPLLLAPAPGGGGNGSGFGAEISRGVFVPQSHGGGGGTGTGATPGAGSSKTALDFRMPEIDLDAREQTSYVCRVFRGDVPRKVVAVDMAEPRHAYAHHMTFFTCPDDPDIAARYAARAVKRSGDGGSIRFRLPTCTYAQHMMADTETRKKTPTQKCYAHFSCSDQVREQRRGVRLRG